MTFACDMSPHGAGDRRLVPDEVARKLQEEGALSANEPWPPRTAPKKPVRPQPQPARPAGVPDTRKAS